MQKKPNKGFAIHCHHDILVEYCYDYQERVKAIKETKPKNEQAIRLKLFKILPKQAIKDIPVNYQKAYANYQKADANYQKADANYQKALTNWVKAYTNCQKIYDNWSQKSKDAFHKKWCGCKEWKNNQICFKEE